MTAPSESERADAMAWLDRLADGSDYSAITHRVHILKAMLAEPRIPEEPTFQTLGAMLEAHIQHKTNVYQWREVYRALRAHLLAVQGPPKTKTVEVWHVEAVDIAGPHELSVTVYLTEQNARSVAEQMKADGNADGLFWACIRVTGPHLQEVPA